MWSFYSDIFFQSPTLTDDSNRVRKSNYIKIQHYRSERLCICTQAGRVTVAFWRATPVWLRIRPFIVAPVLSVTAVAPSNTPSICAPDPISTAPETTQTMLRAIAPPERMTLTLEDVVNVPAIWNMNAVEMQNQLVFTTNKEQGYTLSRLLPETVMLLDKVTPDVHL